MGGLVRSAFAGALIAALVTAAPASAAVPHTVVPGETLWSIAAASNFTTRALAAANGMSETAQVYVGQTIQIPSEAEAASALAGAGTTSSSGTSSGPGPMGGYTVQAGDTLSGIAARSGISTEELAWMNGLDPNAFVIEGTALKLPTGAPDAGQTTTATAQVAPAAEPNPTDEYVSAAQVQQVAADHGVPPRLAAAIAKQESGYYNGWVSSANARGVMQILPGTWDYIEDSIAGHDINPSSAQENVHAGVMYIGRLLQDTGGDETKATASYYQGLGSVTSNGLLPETEQYVNNVFAIRNSLP